MFAFLEEVSRSMEEEVFDLDGLEVSSESFGEKEVSSINGRGEGRIPWSISFNLRENSRRMGEERMLQIKKLISFMKSSWKEWEIELLTDCLSLGTD